MFLLAEDGLFKGKTDACGVVENFFQFIVSLLFFF